MDSIFEFKIFVPTVFFNNSSFKFNNVEIKNKEMKINYLLFFSKKINTNEINKIIVKDNLILGKEKDLVIFYNNTNITFQFLNTEKLYKLKSAIEKSKIL
jgi:hypothetical protein